MSNVTEQARTTAEQFVDVVRTNMGIDPRFAWRVERFAYGDVEIRLPFDESFRRAGGTVSGPTLFALVDLALYGAVMSVSGLHPMALTTDMTLHFLRRPPCVTLAATAKIIKAGRRLVYGAIEVTQAGDESVLAHATGTYSVPPRD